MTLALYVKECSEMTNILHKIVKENCMAACGLYYHFLQDGMCRDGVRWLIEPRSDNPDTWQPLGMEQLADKYQVEVLVMRELLLGLFLAGGLALGHLEIAERCPAIDWYDDLLVTAYDM